MRTRRLLVANRGEIAARVFRTCARLGIQTVAVATDEDVDAFHTRAADDTVGIVSYLDPREIVRAALDAGADAVHPGYGFLAESADLARAVAGAGLTWVGPPGEVLARGGDKLEAKRVATAAGIPLLETGDARAVGLPLMVKAAAGGGGRGMRIVGELAQLDAAVDAARREAEAAFGDPTVFCERYLPRPRHVEVQLLADAGGTVVAVGERDCSVQRRHQKVVEESPAPELAPELRRRIADHAVAFARELGYENAGTAEFLVAGNDVFFLELNGRIQVEHPVTEAVTGLDLVEWQLRIAEGERLDGLSVQVTGHAIEARLYAEDPVSFLPRSGVVERLRLPSGIRVDAGIAEGDTVGTRFDPLVAKLVAHAPTRPEALDRLAAALEETDVRGVVTNLPFLRWLVAHPAFRAAELSTAFLVEHPPLTPPPLRRGNPAWRRPWRLNLPPPLPAAPPELDRAEAARATVGTGVVASPMPGTVLSVDVEPGDAVAARAPLVTLEAMKLEHAVVAPHPGVVTRLHVRAGDQVAAGAPLVELGPLPSAPCA